MGIGYLLTCVVATTAMLILFAATAQVEALHLKGTFDTRDFFKFLGRFGVQATDQHDSYDTRGYIYGNITLLSTHDMGNTTSQDFPNDQMIMLSVMDYNFFIDYYNKRRVLPASVACPMMFVNIEKTAFFYDCNEAGRQDFLRRVPCPVDRACVDEDNVKNLVPGHQFTFKIHDTNQARFWYISLVACTRETKEKKCTWLDVSSSIRGTSNESMDSHPWYTLAYDIRLVNGHPSAKGNNRFEHEYSYELYDIFEIYLGSFLIYSIVLPFMIYRIYYHFHYMYLLLCVYVGVELTSRFFALLHHLVFAYNGIGVFFFQLVGDCLEATANSILILILICVAKGWTVRSKQLPVSRKFIYLSALLQSSLIVCHMIALATIDPVFNKNPYETAAGFVELSIRLVCMCWFLVELKDTFDHLESAAIKNTTRSGTDSQTENTNQVGGGGGDTAEDTDLDEDDYVVINNGKRYARLDSQSKKTDNNTSGSSYFPDYVSKEERLRSYQKFYLHYGACCLVWFIYLPMLIFVTSFVSELFRLRLVLSIRYFVNFISVAVLVYIMWSPKIPLRLPGKKASFKQELYNIEYTFHVGAGDDSFVNANEQEDVVYDRVFD